MSQGELVANLTAERFSLSPREADVLRLLVAGESTAQIQDTLCIAPGTFNYHMRNIYTKLSSSPSRYRQSGDDGTAIPIMWYRLHLLLEPVLS